jgi:hypothetical protein
MIKSLFVDVSAYWCGFVSFPVRKIPLQSEKRDKIDQDHNPAYQYKDASNRLHVISTHQTRQQYKHIPDGCGCSIAPGGDAARLGHNPLTDFLKKT